MKFLRYALILAFASACQLSPKPEGFTPSQMEFIRTQINAAISQSMTSRFPAQALETGGKRPSQKSLKRNVMKSKTVIGRVEWISTIAPKIDFRSRIDTGAQSCSMHAENILEKTIDGVRYVEFTTLDEDSQPHSFLKKVVKMTNVKGTSGVAEKRYVVKMDLIFGDRSLSVNVNLNDRKNLKHRFLVGRNLLIGDYIVDVSQSRLLGDRQ